jgi:hypothetical protein
MRTLLMPLRLTADMEGLATGRNADGSTNFTGQALNDVATLNISRMIDTSTAAGKLLATRSWAKVIILTPRPPF